MKHLNFLSNLLSLSLGSPCTDVSLDRRLTVGSPSGRYCSGLIRLVFILAILLTVGVGNAWGATETLTMSDMGWSNASTQTSIPASSATIALAKNSGSTPTYYTSDGLRIYGVKKATTGGTIAFTAVDEITGIAFTHTSNNSGVLAIKTGTGTYSSKAWSGTLTAGNTVTLVVTNNTNNAPQVRITVIAITYKAKVTFNANGGSCATANATQSTPTSTVTLPTPTRAGFTCTGWYTASSGGTKRGNAGATYTPSASETLYAQWESSAPACSNAVALSKGSATNGTVNTISSASVATCSATASDRRVTVTITPAACYDAPTNLTWTKTSGTVSASKQSGPTDNGDGTYSYVYQFAQNNNGAGTFGVTCTAKAAGKTVNFDAGPGSCLTSSLTETCDGSGVTLPAVTATGVCKGWTTFAGWRASAIATADSTTTNPGTLYAAGSTYYPSSNGETLYAVFSKTKSTGGSSGSVVVTHTSTNFPDGYGTANTFTEYTLEGYKFKIQQIYNNSKMQWRASGNSNGTGTIYNTETFPNHITSIVIVYTNDDSNKNISLKVGTSENPTSGTSITPSSSSNTYTFDCSGGTYDYFVLTNGSGAGYTSSVTINYGSTSTTYYCSDPNCCTALGSINGSVSWNNPTEVVVSWDNLDHVSSWTVACKVHGGSAAGTIGSITTNGEGKKTCTITGLTCNTDYDFTITANPAIGYCEKEETLENKNSGKWNVAYSLTGVTKSSGPATGANVCGDYTAVFTPSNAAYALPSDVTVQIGGVTKTKDTDYTWDSSTGTLSIASNKITGDLSITVTGILVGCSADPTIGAASLSGAFGLSSVGVTVGTSSTGSAYCAWTDYGFVWGTSADPTVSDNKVQIGNSDAATTWSGNLTGSFSVGTTYYFRAYGKNGKEDATYVYSSDASFTPRSVTCESVTGGTISAGTEVSVSGKTITLTATPDSHFSFGSWTVTNNSTSATITVTNNQFTMPDANVTVTATFNEDAYKTVTFYNNSTNTGITGYTNMKVYVGDTPSEPTLTDGTSGDACDATSDKHYGWSRDTWSGTIDTEAHMTGSPGNHTVYQKGSVPAVVAGDPATISYHAVWAAGSQYWGRLTSSELSGLSAGTELVIVAVDQGYVLQNDLTCSNSVPAETDGKISPTDNIKWTLAGSAGAWQLKSGTDILGTQYNSCAGSGNGVVLAFNLNHQTYSIASSSHATNEFYIKDNACDYGVLTKVSKYDDIRIVNVSSYSSVASAALKLYIKKGSYSEFITNCCSASTLAFAASPYAVIRQNIGGASTTTWAEVDVTFTSNNTTGAISATTYTDGKTVYKLSSWEGRGTTGGTLCANDHAYFEVLTQPSGETPGTGKFHVKTTSGQTGQGTYRIALTQESTDESHGNFCETTAYGFVDVTLRDKFVDNVNGNGTVNRDGHGAQLATPTLSEFGTQVEDACHEEGRKLKGWIKETDLKAQYETGNSTRVQTIDGLCESCSSASDQTLLIVTPGTNVTMSGATWYAVWAYEK